jgi:hypothetical protein
MPPSTVPTPAAASLAVAADEHAVGSLCRWGLVRDDAARQRLTHSKIGHAAAVCFPSAERTVLMLIADWLMWLTALDDVHEGVAAEAPGGLEALLGGLVRAIEDPDGVNQEAAARSLAELSRRLRDAATPAQRARITDAIHGVFLAMVWEAASDLPSVEDYLTMRRHLGFGLVCAAFAELAAGVELPDSAVYAPAMRTLAITASNVIAWSNDLGSFAWEHQRRAGRSHNLVSLLMRRQRRAVQQATAQVEDMLDRELRYWHEAKSALADRADPPLAAYLDALGRLVAGALTFYQYTDRYRLDGRSAQRPPR